MPESSATENSPSMVPSSQATTVVSEAVDAGPHSPSAAGAANVTAGVSLGSSVLTTPRFAGQTEPAEALEYSPTYAEGEELKDRKRGDYKRPRAGDDDDAY